MSRSIGHKHAAICLLVVVAASLLIAGCSGRTDSDLEVSSSEREAQEQALARQRTGPEVTLAGKTPAEQDVLLRYYGDDPDTLNLITANDNVSAEFHRPVYEYLAMRSYGDPQQWEPLLAESWEFDKEKLEYTIHLRQGVYWHPINLPNGKPLPRKEFTARDVKFTFDAILNESVEAASLRSYYVDPDAVDPQDRVKIEVTVIDKYTVKVKWKKPYFMSDEFTLMVQMMPRHVYSVDQNGEPISFDFSSKEFAEGFNDHWANSMMCGTGPTILKEWRKGQQATFVRNPEYWGHPMYFSQVIFRHITNPNTARQQLLQGELDWGMIPEIDAYIQSKKHPNVLSGKVDLKEFHRTAYRYIGYNLQRDLFQDPQVRLALSYATPVDQIIEQIYHGLGARVTGPFVPGGVFSDETVEPIPFDLAKAEQLLKEAGWEDTNNNGVRDKVVNGRPVELRFDMMIFADSPQYQSIAETIKANWRNVGVDILISPTKWALFLQKLNKKEFDAMILGWVADYKSDPFQLWHGSQADLPNSSNFGYQNPEVDEAIEQLRVTLDEEEQIELYHKIHRLIHEDQPYTFLYAEKATAALNARIENVEFYPMLRPHYDVREWYSTTPRILNR